ncbi:MAG: WYL domain-containing transcriptional regulator [Firmicutes bacterium]|nr:WYL domain-containing transcriptional regulator [Bacillota bacterium]
MFKASARIKRPVTRKPFWRIVEIHRLIEAGAYPSLTALSERFEVSPRTIQRDLELLKDFLRAPLVYDRARGGYRYDGPFTLPRLYLTAGELTVLLIGQRILAELAGTPLAEEAQTVMEKLPVLLGEEVSVDLDRFSQKISFGLPRVRGDEDLLARHFDLLSEAMANSRTVAMEYYAASTDDITHREVDPYHLRLEAGAWYLIGHCHLRGELRIFALDRIRTLSLTGKSFVKPADFSIEDYLGHSWGIERGTAEYTVKVAFDREQARWVRERVWMEGQRTIDLPDGGLILELRVSGLFSIMRWILGFGRHAVVLEPPELKAAIEEEAVGILAACRSRGSVS